MKHLWPLLLLAACGDDATSPDTSAEDAVPDVASEIGGEVGADVADIACDDVVIDDVELGAGQRLTIALHGATVTAPLPPGLTRIDGADLVVQVDYATQGTLAIPVTITCADGERSFEWHPRVRPMSWTQAPVWTDASGPAAREHTTFWIDPATPDVLTLHGGLLYEPQQGTNTNDMWHLDLQTLTWSSFTPAGTAPLRATGRAFPAPDGHGFWTHAGDIAGDPTAGVDAFDGTTWSVAPIDKGFAVELHATVYDAPRHRIVTLLGIRKNFILSTAIGVVDVDGGPWQTLVTANTGPDARYGFAYALQGDRLVIVSGARAPVTGDAVNAAHDVWALDLAADPPLWSELHPDDGGHAFRNAAFAYDDESERLFVFGGTADGAHAVPGLSILDLTRGHERWVHLAAADYSNAPPPDRASCTGSWDPKHRRFIVGFGNSEAGLFTDLWTLAL